MRIYDAWNRIRSTVLLMLLCLAGGTVGGTVFESGDDIRVSHLHSIEDDFFAWGDNITVDGVIEGDAFLSGSEIEVRGEITGSENALCMDFVHNGLVGRSLRVTAMEATIGGDIERSLVALAHSVTIEPDAVIGRDAHLRGFFEGRVHVEGRIGGDLYAAGDSVVLSGKVDGNVFLKGASIAIEPPATITGDLTYSTTRTIDIDTTAGVVVRGEIIEREPDVEVAEEEAKAADELADIAFVVSKFLAAFLFGVILIVVFRRYADETYRQLQDRFGLSTVSGVLAILLTVFCIIVLIIAGILVAIGLAVASDNVVLGSLILVVSTLLVPITSFASVSGGVLFYSGKIVMAMLVGCLIWRQVTRDCQPLSKLQLFVGLAVLTILFSVPYIGFVIYLIASIIGAGAIVLGVRHCRRSWPDESPPTPPASGEPPSGAPPSENQL